MEYTTCFFPMKKLMPKYMYTAIALHCPCDYVHRSTLYCVGETLSCNPTDGYRQKYNVCSKMMKPHSGFAFLLNDRFVCVPNLSLNKYLGNTPVTVQNHIHSIPIREYTHTHIYIKSIIFLSPSPSPSSSPLRHQAVGGRGFHVDAPVQCGRGSHEQLPLCGRWLRRCRPAVPQPRGALQPPHR